IIIITDSSD
ncbi:hypothetical protein ACKAV7_014892, partial [Fusarium commune]